MLGSDTIFRRLLKEVALNLEGELFLLLTNTF